MQGVTCNRTPAQENIVIKQRSTTIEPTGEKLPDAELEVLACLWQAGEATAADHTDEDLEALKAVGYL